MGKADVGSACRGPGVIHPRARKNVGDRGVGEARAGADLIYQATFLDGDLVGHAMPACRMVLALVRQRARTAGVY
jgi:hypothetical protein